MQLGFVSAILPEMKLEEVLAFAADEGKAKVKSGVVAIANTAPDGKGGLVVGVTDDLTGRFNAIDLVRAGAEALGGKGGGGRPDLAQAGGPDGERADQALEAIAAKIAGGVAAPTGSA